MPINNITNNHVKNTLFTNSSIKLKLKFTIFDKVSIDDTLSQTSDSGLHTLLPIQI